jgi:hypothetical protein
MASDVGVTCRRLTRCHDLTNNDGVIRRFIAIGLSVAVQTAAFSAPLVHAHPDDHATDHHAPRSVHAHVSAHAVPAPAGDEAAFRNLESERTVFLQLFVAISGASIEVPAASVTAFQLAAPEETSAHLSLQIVHGHDPPVASAVASRAPPAFLS